VPCLYVAAAAAPFMAVATVLVEALRGAGDTRTALGVTVVCGIAVRLVASWWLGFEMGLGLVGVWLGSTADWVVRVVLLTLAWRGGRWKTIDL